MKLSTVFIGALSVFQVAQAIEVNLANPADSDVQGEYLDVDQQVPFQYDIQYQVSGKPQSDVLEFYNGEEITLEYFFGNNEPEEVTIVGVGGHFANPISADIVANITDAKVGPIVIPPGESRTFNQRIGINLPSNNYLLSPGLYVVRGSTLALLGARTQLAIVDDKPISFFNPQLVILELLLLATLSVGGYFVWTNYGADYFKSTVQAANVSKSGVKSSAKASGSEKKTVDESWLPDSHIKKTNSRKNK